MVNEKIKDDFRGWFNGHGVFEFTYEGWLQANLVEIKKACRPIGRV